VTGGRGSGWRVARRWQRSLRGRSDVVVGDVVVALDDGASLIQRTSHQLSPSASPQRSENLKMILAIPSRFHAASASIGDGRRVPPLPVSISASETFNHRSASTLRAKVLEVLTAVGAAGAGQPRIGAVYPLDRSHPVFPACCTSVAHD